VKHEKIKIWQHPVTERIYEPQQRRNSQYCAKGNINVMANLKNGKVKLQKYQNFNPP
jgi:hypothetical protein